jgi:protein TonB
MPPTKIKDVVATYPPGVSYDIRGTVILEITIAETGKVTDAHVLRSIPALDQAAIDCVMQWEYTPTLLDGTPVPVRLTVTVPFGMKPSMAPRPPP